MNLPLMPPRERTPPHILPGVVVLAVVAAALAVAPGALANTTKSSNWAGYAVHRSGIKFKQVSGTWKQPAAVCTPGIPTFASAWVGLGGFRESSRTLEQIGSEVDCNAHGKVVSSVWFELVPAPSHTIRIKVNPGDALSASVTVVGHTVALLLRDLTRHRSFTYAAHVAKVDVSSAEWIVEAPAQCRRGSLCRLLPLADFGSARFTRAGAVSSTGHAGSISDRKWTATQITLASRAHHFVDTTGAPAVTAASPSALSAGGRSFPVTYMAAAATSSVSIAPGQTSASLRIVRPALSRR